MHLYFIKEDNNKILAYVNQVGKDNLLNSILSKKSWDNYNAWTLYRIGETYFNTGNVNDAFIFYKKANELAPFNLEFKNKLGASLMAQRKVDEAISIFTSILKENPKFVLALNNLGYAELTKGNISEAETLYNRALKLDPDYEPLLLNVAGLNIYKKKYVEAKLLLNQILKKNPNNQQVKKVLTELKEMKV